jgi:hypothetical protein
MNYKEISRKEETTITTEIEYVFNVNGKEIIEIISVPHFCPKDEKDIQLGISNRYESRLRELIENIKLT